MVVVPGPSPSAINDISATLNAEPSSLVIVPIAEAVSISTPAADALDIVTIKVSSYSGSLSPDNRQH